MSRSAALISAVALLSCAQAAGASAATPFLAKRGTVSIAFNASVTSTFQKLGVEFNNGNGHPVTGANFPTLSIEPASAEPSRAPTTPLSTSKPSGFVYISTPAVDFYQQLPEANTQGGILFPEIALGAHPALEGSLNYTLTGAAEVSGGGLKQLFLLNTSHIRPVLRGSTLTLKNIPITLAPAGARFFSLFGPGFSSGMRLGTLTIRAIR